MNEPARMIVDARLELRIAGADVSIDAPAAVLAVVERMLAHVPRTPAKGEAHFGIEARFERDVWRVRGSAPKGSKTLAGASALPQVAGAIVSSALAELAYRHTVRVWRAAAVERDGEALVLTGDDWETIVTLVAHLHARGWSVLSGDYALVDRETFVATNFSKLLYANSFCVPSFPLRYRPAIEASPWYSTGNGIAFYAIDPLLVEDSPEWGSAAAMRALVRVDGHCAEHPSLEVTEDFRVGDGLRRSDLMTAGIEAGMLVRGGFIETCDFLERWFASVSR